MTLTSNWEHPLLERANAALRSFVSTERVQASAAALERAYRHCDALTAQHSRTFYLASGLLPPARRRAVRALYAFCRVTDDLVDRAEQDGRAALESWRGRVFAPHPGHDDLVALAWADTRARHSIPWSYAEQLIDGVARDLTHTRYESFEELSEYCYGVACTVGLMTMHIVGFAGQAAIPHAIKLGVALQLTNILRDVEEDWRAGRLYLPRAELAAFGLSEADIAAGRATPAWREFIGFQIARVRQLYAQARPGIALLDPTGRLAIAAAADLYQAILDEIEARGGDVFGRRARVSGWGKLRRLPGIWWRVRHSV